MSFAFSFTVNPKYPYPTFKRIHLIDRPAKDLTTVDRKIINRAIHEMYKTVNPKVDGKYYGVLGLTGNLDRPYTAALTEDKRVKNYFEH